MNENLQTAVVALIEKSLAAVDTTTTFLVAEIPDVVQQLLMWHMVKSAVYMLVGIALLVAISAYWVAWYRAAKRDSEGFESSGAFIGGIVGTVGSALLLPASVIYMDITWLQIWIAPKVWLIEYAARLVK